MRGEMRRLRRQAYGYDHLTLFKHALALRRIERQAVKGLERDLACTCAAFNLNDGIERDQRHAEIRRMRGDAALAPSEDRVQPVVAAASVAAGSRIALIAGAGGVVEI